MYDRGPKHSELTSFQNIFLAFIVLKRQRLKILEVVALCRASLCSANTSLGTKVIEGAHEALTRYVKEAENIFQEEEKTRVDLAKMLQKEAQKAYLIQPT